MTIKAKEGKDTTEWQGTKWGMILSVVLPVIWVIFDRLLETGMIKDPTFMVVAGIITSVLAALGYGGMVRMPVKVSELKGRTALELAGLGKSDVSLRAPIPVPYPATDMPTSSDKSHATPLQD